MNLPVETRALRLRQLEPADAPVMLALSREDSARAGLPSQIYRDDAHARAALEHLIQHYSRSGNPRLGPYVLAMEHRDDGALIGHVGFSPLDDVVEIGFSVAEAYQGRGLAAEAVAAASRWAIEQFDLGSIVAITASTNVASKRTLARAGYAYEGDTRMNFQGSEETVSCYRLARVTG